MGDPRLGRYDYVNRSLVYRRGVNEYRDPVTGELRPGPGVAQVVDTADFFDVLENGDE